MKALTRISLWTVRILLAAVLLLNVLIIFTDSGSLQLLESIPFGAVEVSGGSMEPILHHGDAILVVHTPFEDVKNGDIILFRQDGALIIHEVIARDDESITTRGRANAVIDRPVTEEEYLARMITRVPALGSIWRISASPAKFAVFAVLVTLLVFGTDIFPAVYRVIFERERHS